MQKGEGIITDTYYYIVNFALPLKEGIINRRTDRNLNKILILHNNYCHL